MKTYEKGAFKMVVSRGFRPDLEFYDLRRGNSPVATVSLRAVKSAVFGLSVKSVLTQGVVEIGAVKLTFERYTQTSVNVYFSYTGSFRRTPILLNVSELTAFINFLTGL